MADVTEQTEDTGGRRSRGEGRGAAARRASRTGGGAPPSLPYITRKIREYEVLDEEGLALIEANADLMLEEIGIEFRDDEEALATCGNRPAPTCAGERVHFPKGLCRRAVENRTVHLHLACAQPGAQRSRSAARRRSSRRSTARPSCAISKASAATRRSRISAIS